MKRQKNNIHKILFITTITILVLLMVQTLTSFIHLPALEGVTVENEMPELTYANMMDGSYQDGFEKYGRDHFGFREWLIPLYNQFEWDFFKKVEQKGIFFGQDNWLYFYEMVQDQYESLTFKYAKSGEEMAGIFEKDAMKVYYLQEILKEYGTTLFVCIAPSKNELYPEFLPPNNNRFVQQGGIHADDYYVDKFRELGVNCLDLNTVFKSWKGKVDFPLYYKGSSHYSVIAATHAADTLLRYMEHTSGLNLQNFTVRQAEIKKPINIDRDLENLFNLIRPFEKTNYYYAGIDPIPDSTAVKTRWLTIGDSYYWYISEGMRAANIFESTPFWYYGHEVYFDGESDFLAQNHNLTDELIEADFVMLLWCPINLYDLEHNFVNTALLSLCCHDNYSSSLITNIKENPDWYNSVVEKAKKNGKDIEEQLKLDVDWVIQEKIETDFNLSEKQIPSARNGKIANMGKWFNGKSPEEIRKIKHAYRELKKNDASTSNEILMAEATRLLFPTEGKMESTKNELVK